MAEIFIMMLSEDAQAQNPQKQAKKTKHQETDRPETPFKPGKQTLVQTIANMARPVCHHIY